MPQLFNLLSKILNSNYVDHLRHKIQETARFIKIIKRSLFNFYFSNKVNNISYL